MLLWLMEGAERWLAVLAFGLLVAAIAVSR
jgi:hypothetical protein